MEVTIATLFAGREYSLEPYFYGLEHIDGEFEYVTFTNSENKDFRRKLKRRVKGRFFEIDDVPVSRNSYVESGEHKQEHAETIAKLYNLLFDKIETDYFLLLEDDIIAPSNAIKGLLECYSDNVGYACGVQMCRHNNSVFVWDLDVKSTFGEKDACQELQYYAKDIVSPYGIREIGLGHFGLTMLKKSICEKIQKPIFKPRSDIKGAGALVGCDIVMGLELHLLGYKRMCNFDVRAHHMDGKGKIH